MSYTPVARPLTMQELADAAAAHQARRDSRAALARGTEAERSAVRMAEAGYGVAHIVMRTGIAPAAATMLVIGRGADVLHRRPPAAKQAVRSSKVRAKINCLLDAAEARAARCHR